MLPFTHAQFVEVFVQYNANVWPAQVAAYLLGLAVVAALIRPRAGAGKWIAAALAVMWLWIGIAYHAIHFSEINNAAFLFAALFVVQALLFLQAGLAGQLQFAGARKWPSWLGGGLILYALLLYPLLGMWTGQRYPEMPMFGITPCPATIFTFGVLLFTTSAVPRRLLVIPVLWSLIGGSAAFLLQVPQDWLLLVSGLSVVPLLLRHRAARVFHPA